jgi:hypothetical protein
VLAVQFPVQLMTCSTPSRQESCERNLQPRSCVCVVQAAGESDAMVTAHSGSPPPRLSARGAATDARVRAAVSVSRPLATASGSAPAPPSKPTGGSNRGRHRRENRPTTQRQETGTRPSAVTSFSECLAVHRTTPPRAPKPGATPLPSNLTTRAKTKDPRVGVDPLRWTQGFEDHAARPNPSVCLASKLTGGMLPIEV